MKKRGSPSLKRIKRELTMKNLRLTIVLCSVLAFLAYTGCDIEQAQPVIHLAPPLGLLLYNTNNTILLTFQGLNKESYFSGYTVNISTDTNTWYKVWYAPDDSNTITMPEANSTAGSSPTVFSINISNEIIPPLTLNVGTEYFFYVQAYSSQFSVYSLPSEIDGIVYYTNTNTGPF